jgi:hypothetical protein
MKQLAKAVLAVMDEVKGVDKSMTVGSGQNTYKGVSDKDVKTAIGRAMQKHGLTLLPIGIEDVVQVDRWEETNQYGTKQKQNINVSVKTKYLLLHESGESQEVMGYGHGIDPQDKAAGKATTYALKNLMLYMFLVPTGTIDDTDNTHSDNIPTPPPVAVKPKAKTDLIPTHPKWLGAVSALAKGETTIEAIRKAYNVSDDNATKLAELAADFEQ